VHKKTCNIFLNFIVKKFLPVRNWWYGTATPVRGAEPASWCGCPPLLMCAIYAYLKITRLPLVGFVSILNPLDGAHKL